MYSPDDFQRQFAVSRETMERLQVYAGLLAKWQKKINLVSAATLPDVWQRHFADSAQLFAHLDPKADTIDLGSGAGFPGAVLSIMGVRGMRLLESDRRKCAFLREVARQTNADYQVIEGRIESYAGPPARLVTARALADLKQLLDYSAPLLQKDGACLFLKGKTGVAEKAAAGKDWSFDSMEYPSLTDPEGTIIKLFHVKQII